MESFNYDKFISDLKVILRDEVEKINNEFGKEKLCGFSVFSDGDAGSLVVAYHTTDDLLKKFKQFPKEREYYKWYPDEWDKTIDNEKINELSKRLFNVKFVEKKADFFKHREKIFSSIVEVLSELKKEGFFTRFTRDFVLVFTVTDYDEAEKQISWIKILNEPKLANEYENWRKSW